MVYDVFQYMGKTQVVLLQLPARALLLAQEQGIKLTQIKAFTEDAEKLKILLAATSAPRCQCPYMDTPYPPRGLKPCINPLGLTTR